MTEFTITSVGSKKIQLIKCIRAYTGLGLREAKEACDAADRGEVVRLRSRMSLADMQGDLSQNCEATLGYLDPPEYGGIDGPTLAMRALAVQKGDVRGARALIVGLLYGTPLAEAAQAALDAIPETGTY